MRKSFWKIKSKKEQGKEEAEALKVLKLAEHKPKPKSIEEIISKELENNEI